MQEEVENRTVNLAISTTKLTGMSAPMIKCKKTARKKCRFVAERRKKIDFQ